MIELTPLEALGNLAVGCLISVPVLFVIWVVASIMLDGNLPWNRK
jgi:hypothetical protein